MSFNIYPQNHLLHLSIESVQSVTGIISETHFRKDNYHKYEVTISQCMVSDRLRRVCGKILLSTRNVASRYRVGDLICITGKLEYPARARNPGQFDYQKYLATKNIYHIINIQQQKNLTYLDSGKGFFLSVRVIFPIKDYCERVFRKYLSNGGAALLHALLLGEKQDLDQNEVINFQRVGVAHVLAISGLHVGFIVLFLSTLFSLLRLAANQRILLLILVLCLYVILVQFKPPVLRASMMSVLYLIGNQRERKISVYNIILATAAIILIYNPVELFNPGFQFSFLAVLSIVYGYNKLDQLLPLQRVIKRNYTNKIILNKLLSWIWIPFLVSTSAVCGTLPLTIYYYGMIPVVALFANIFIIPIVGALVILGIFLLITALFSNFIASGIGEMINLVYNLLQYLVKLMARSQLASFDTPIPPFLIILLALTCIYLFFNLNKTMARKSILAIILFIGLSYLLMKTLEKKTLEISFLDVGQGDAAYIRFPKGTTMLIDAGNSSSYWDHGTKTILPYLKKKGKLHLNYLVGSHGHNDHIGGILSLITRIRVDTLVISGYEYNSKNYLRLLDFCNSENIAIKYVYRGDQLFPDLSCRVYILHPNQPFSEAKSRDGTECNNSSIVIKIQFGDNGILFTGDLEKSGEIPVLEYGDFLESEIIKVGHHGSSSSTSPKFLQLIQPLIAIVSVAKKNKFDHPSPLTIKNLKLANSKVYSTSQQGAILFNIKPRHIQKIQWRKFR